VGIDVQTAEIFTVITLLVIAGTHALLFIIYFYADDGIRAQQKTERAIANSVHKGRTLVAAGKVLKQAEGAIILKRSIEDRHGAQGVEALAQLMTQLLDDQNADGIPDILQNRNTDRRPMSPAPQYQPQERVPLGPNGSGNGRGESERPNS
jgi:hypothetical protein